MGQVAGCEARRRRSPRPTASGRDAGREPAQPEGLTWWREWRSTQPGTQRASGPQVWATLGESMGAGRGPNGLRSHLGKSASGYPAPALLPLSAACSMHSSYSGGGAPGLGGAH